MRNIFYYLIQKQKHFGDTGNQKPSLTFRESFVSVLFPSFWGDPMTHRVGGIFSEYFFMDTSTTTMPPRTLRQRIPKPPEVTDIAEL